MDVELRLDEAEVWSRQAIVMFWKGHNFWSDHESWTKFYRSYTGGPFQWNGCESDTRWSNRWIAKNFLQEFQRLWSGCGIDTQWEVWSRQARVTVWTGHNFWSDCWIAIKRLQEISYALVHGVDVESILGEEEVCLRQASVTVRIGHNFWSNRWISI